MKTLYVILTSACLFLTPLLAGNITLSWTTPYISNTNAYTEIWSSTNLIDWSLKTSVVKTNSITLPANNQSEFFKLRTRIQTIYNVNGTKATNMS